MKQLVVQSNPHWVRSKDGIIAGVCQGLGNRLGVEPWLIRLASLVAVFAFGTGILLYFIAAFALPREDRLFEAQEPKILGVCARLAQRFGIETGLVRVAAIALAIGSLGTTGLVYILLHFVLDGQSSGTYLT